MNDERASLIEEIRILPELLEDAVNDMSKEELDTPYRVGGWTRRQVVHHIADSHLMGYARTRWVIAEQQPLLKPYDQDRWAAMPDSKLPIDVSLDILRGLHARWCEFLSGVPEEGWERTGDHPEDGIVSLDDLLKSYARHGRHHVEQIRVDRSEQEG